MIWFSKSQTDKEQAFWHWFMEHEDELLIIQTGQEPALAELAKQLSSVNKGLSFEFGPPTDDKREFFLSGGGIQDVFPAVESLYAAAPPMEKWTIVRFKQRKGIGELRFADKVITADDVFYVLVDDDGKIGIDLFFEDYKESLFRLYANIGFILLDNVLGEFDVATKVGEINFRSIQEDAGKQAQCIGCLADEFDAKWKSMPEEK